MPYMPVLKIKEAELNGLSHIIANVQSNIIPTLPALRPLFEFLPRPWDYKKNTWKMTAQQHMVNSLERIAKKRAGHQFLLDFHYLIGEIVAQDIVNLISYLSQVSLTSASQLLLPAVPVVYPSMDISFLQAASQINSRLGQGIALRFSTNEDLQANLSRCLSALNTQPSNIDLVLDLKDQITGNITTQALLNFCDQWYDTWLQLGPWRTITFLGGSFPPDFTNFGSNTVTSIPREEWRFWLQLLQYRAKKNKQNYFFGDYGPLSPHPLTGNTSVMRPVVKIRYAVDDKWLLIKGISTGMGSSYPQIAAELRRRPEYAGAQYSWGDHFIAQCSNQSGQTGNHGTWISVAVNRHVVLVLDQLASWNAL